MCLLSINKFKLFGILSMYTSECGRDFGCLKRSKRCCAMMKVNLERSRTMSEASLLGKLYKDGETVVEEGILSRTGYDFIVIVEYPANPSIKTGSDL